MQLSYFRCIIWIEIPFRQTWASTLGVSYLRRVGYDTEHYLVVNFFRQMLSPSKRAEHMFGMESSMWRSYVEVTEEYEDNISKCLCINKSWSILSTSTGLWKYLRNYQDCSQRESRLLRTETEKIAIWRQMLQIVASGDEVGRSVIIRSKPNEWGKSEQCISWNW